MKENLPQIYAIVGTVITATAAIISTLYSKFIETRSLELDILLRRRIDLYEKFITTASNYVYVSGGDGVEYQEYLKAYNSARLIASKNTQEALKKVSISTNKLRTLEGNAKTTYSQTDWYNNFENVCNEMSVDIANLTKRVNRK
ncbi:hypothetical protein ABE82_26310 (plasmid) [Paenibacillus peoriae]|uniref:hypothetical protein n=1 Tax=Paenibacillus peoriae TaxID=59893 RepID=UPI000722BE43|nr:hypothetical protein [Paenibacillus peoriae]ALS09931.1 hypothetical protein ABE82_26310 [Paenibacillus peoriae]